MSAKLTAQSQAAREAILESLPQLKSRLAAQGFEVSSFAVEVTTEGTGIENQMSSGDRGTGSHQSSGNPQPTDLRRSNFSRRQLDSFQENSRAIHPGANGSQVGLDLQA
jgi:flagellar hook-length control protein FliK